jgi:hypothetical protein
MKKIEPVRALLLLLSVTIVVAFQHSKRIHASKNWLKDSHQEGSELNQVDEFTQYANMLVLLKRVQATADAPVVADYLSRAISSPNGSVNRTEHEGPQLLSLDRLGCPGGPRGSLSTLSQANHSTLFTKKSNSNAGIDERYPYDLSP